MSNPRWAERYANYDTAIKYLQQGQTDESIKHAKCFIHNCHGENLFDKMKCCFLLVKISDTHEEADLYLQFAEDIWEIPLGGVESKGIKDDRERMARFKRALDEIKVQRKHELRVWSNEEVKEQEIADSEDHDDGEEELEKWEESALKGISRAKMMRAERDKEIERKNAKIARRGAKIKQLRQQVRDQAREINDLKKLPE